MFFKYVAIQVIFALAAHKIFGNAGVITSLLIIAYIHHKLQIKQADTTFNWLKKVHRQIQEARESQFESEQIPNAPNLKNNWGDTIYMIGRILTAKKKQQDHANARHMEFISAIQAAPSGVVLLDKNGQIEWFNKASSKHLGLQVNRDEGQKIQNLLREPAFTKYYVKEQYEREMKIFAKNSTPAIPVKLSLQLYPYGAGKKLLLSRDITELAQADAMRRDFVANVSHEIRTPLTVLAGFVETMQSIELEQDEQLRYLGLMAAQSARMQTLVNDLLTLSRLEGSPLPDGKEKVDIKSVYAQATAEAKSLSALLHSEKAQKLHFAAPPDIQIGGIANELRSAISNLINNAVRYTPEGGEIKVIWQLTENSLTMTVKDSGSGIAPQHLSRLGERFYRVDKSRSRESGGTGLGLAITKHIIQRHGGELKINSKLGEGSEFSLIFPLSKNK